MKIIIFLLLITLIYLLNYSSEVILSPGIKVNEIPKQTDLENKKLKFLKNDSVVFPVKKMIVKAKILSKKSYSSDILPYDLALGWKDMSNTDILDNMTITQSNRWYFGKSLDLPIPLKTIQVQSSNWHIIPANDNIENIISDMKKGEIIELRGYLANVLDENKRFFKSSLTRNDTKGGSCEVMYVEYANILETN